MTDEKPDKFNRIFGGFAWPAENPGFAVVVGEELTYLDVQEHAKAPQLERKYHVINEFESHNIDLLVKMAIVMKVRHKTQSFYGRLHRGQGKPLPAMNYLESWNNDAHRRKVKSFYILEAPYVEETGLIQYHLNILKPLLDPRKKLLKLYDSKLKMYLTKIPVDVTRIRDTDRSQVAALAYAVSALEVWRPEEDYIEQQQADKILEELYV